MMTYSRAPSQCGRLLKLHKDLVQIESVTGREQTVGNFLIEYFTKHGYRASRQQIPLCSNTPEGWERFNVLAWPGTSKDPSSPPRLLLSAHIDTVPPHIPYSIENGEISAETRISGRGTADTKGAIAAQIVAFEELQAAGLVRAEDVMFLYVVGEETGGDGMRQFSELINGNSHKWEQLGLAGPLPTAGFQAGIFGEPTENKLAKGHKGLLICEITAQGKSGHSGYPWLGKSANELLMRALVKILDEDLGSSERFGNTTVNVGRLDGGVAGNVIAESATASLVIRVAAMEEDGCEQVKGRLLRILQDVDPGAFTVQWLAGYAAVPCDYDVEDFETTVVNFGTDVPVLAGSHAKYLYGPGSILVAHSDDEAVTVGDMCQSVEDYKKLILHVLNP